MEKPTPTPADVAKLTANKTPDAPGNTEHPANQESPTPDTKPEQLTREQLLKELASVRREAANYRTQRNELKPLAEKYQAAEEAKKTELEKAQERIKALETQAETSQAELVRAKVAAETGVPAHLLPAGSQEDVTAAAQALVEWAGKTTTPPTAPVVPGVGRTSNGDDRDAKARQILGI